MDKAELERQQRETAEQAARIFAGMQDELDAKNMGCIIIVASLGEEGALSYFSNIGRQDAITCLLEFLDHLDPAIVLTAVKRWQTSNMTDGESERSTN